MGNEIQDAFDFMMAKDWLNALVDNMEQRKHLEKMNSQISVIPNPEYIQIYSGIGILADVFGEKLIKDDWNENYTVRYFFFRNVKILQLDSKNEESEDGTGREHLDH